MIEKLPGIRNNGIDMLRGLAILSVILLHINIRIPFSETLIGNALPASIYKIIFWSGYYGVCVFFVISGFLITTTALSKWGTLPKLRVLGFYSMRFARIIPLLVVLLLVLSILHLSGIKEFVINPERVTLSRTIIAALTFHLNWLEIKVGYLPGSWDILWSLSIEEVFYLFFPLLCILCKNERNFVILISVFLFISPFARTTWYSGNELGDHNHFAYLDAISIGCIAALVNKRIKFSIPILNVVGVVGWAFFTLVIVFRKWVSLMGLSNIGLNVTLLAIGTALILIWMQKRFIDGHKTAPKYTKSLCFLGRNSYEIYLSHMFVVFILVRVYHALNLFGEWQWILYFLVVIFSGIIGNLISRFFSNPINLFLRERFNHFSISKS
ncbi:MAG: acyltransferase [Prolixibacteraceae bacterium]